MNEKYDLVVIGGGPAGYVGAIRASQLGLKTAIVEKQKSLGGTCLNVGCIPSKAMLQSSHYFELASKNFVSHGIQIKDLKLDLNQMMARKDKVVNDLTKGVKFLAEKNNIDHYFGLGSLSGKGKVKVTSDLKDVDPIVLSTDSTLIATGSETVPLHGVEFDEERIVSSTGALSLSKVPTSMVVIGGGVIGLELGSVWRRLGTQVTIIEFLDVILPGMDSEVSKVMERILKKQGLKFKLRSKVLKAKKTANKVKLQIESVGAGEREDLEAEVVLVSIGRRPVTFGLGLGKSGVELDEKGFLVVDEDYQTNVDGVYAVGDVIGGDMLA